MTKQPLRILLVDDDEVDRKTVVRAFRKYDPEIEIHEADSGEAGLQMFGEISVDCVLLDYRLPDMDGLQILAQMHEENNLLPVPVIMLTGEENLTLAVDAMKNGACDFMVKGSDDRFQNFLPAAIERAMSRQILLREKEKAQAANEAKTDFLSHMSHELRTPLNAVIGFSDLIKDETFGPLGHENYQDYIEHISNSGHQLLGIVDDLLELAKIEAHKYELETQEVDITDLIFESAENVIGGLHYSGARVIRNIDETPVTITADQMAVKKILINILTNAVKFTPDDGEITISLSDNGDSVAIEIADTGIGISPENLSLILEPFVQVERESMNEQEGTGLGLPLAKKLAELHGGNLNIESDIGAGTTVTINLPREPKDVSAHVSE